MDIDVCVLKSTRELFSAAGEKREKALPGKGEGKGPFFPEVNIDTDIRFHFGLLSPSTVIARAIARSNLR
jgi:hypothetical protein